MSTQKNCDDAWAKWEIERHRPSLNLAQRYGSFGASLQRDLEQHFQHLQQEAEEQERRKKEWEEESARQIEAARRWELALLQDRLKELGVDVIPDQNPMEVEGLWFGVEEYSWAPAFGLGSTMSEWQFLLYLPCPKCGNLRPACLLKGPQQRIQLALYIQEMELSRNFFVRRCPHCAH